MSDLMNTEPRDYSIAIAGETAQTAVAAQAKALVEARYVMAIRRPRDWDTVREKMLKECKRPSFAAVARYVKPIGKDPKKFPTGPSIRFAEACVRNMTNVTVETMNLYDDADKRIVRVTVTDLESNVPYSLDIPIAKTIERRQAKQGDKVLGERTNSYGDKVYILQGTDDDIINKQAALVSKAIRTLGMRLMPGDIVDECMDAVIDTQGRADAQDPDAAKRKLFDSFGQVSVTVDQLKAYLGHDGKTLAPKEMGELRGIYSAIRDGETTWRDVMDARAPEGSTPPKGSSTSMADIAKRGAAKKTAASEADPKTGETTPPPAKRSLAYFLDQVKQATNEELAWLIVDESRDDLNDAEQGELSEAVRARYAA